MSNASADVGAATAVYVAAGGNIEPEKNLRLALAELARTWPALHVSTAYRNAAVGFVGPDFINCVVGFETEWPLERVLERLHEIEELCGRPRLAPKWEPRAMDLDILLFGERIDAAARLPRPDLVKRAFMLGPMAEIAPDVRHPTLGATMRELWAAFPQAAHPMTRVDLTAAPVVSR
jgi:2-amino-4-hydroxy-6-hydroxymethyldihydropteridine diphosphokinase